MFSGKGGVGKTTCAAATALHHASSAERTLAISTDATPSLSHIFNKAGGEKPVRISRSLDINELGMAEVKEMWERKFGREVYQVFNSLVDIGYDDFVDFMTSVLPGLSDEFMVDYIREMSRRNSYTNIVWDTAPLGQTLALLQTPAMLNKHLKAAPRIYSRLKLGKESRQPILDIIKGWEKLSAENMEFLRSEVKFSLVTIPEALAVEQLESILRELDRYGLKVQRLVINNVIKNRESPFLQSKARQQKQYLDTLYRRCSHMPITELPLFPYELKGTSRLKEAAGLLFPW